MVLFIYVLVLNFKVSEAESSEFRGLREKKFDDIYTYNVSIRDCYLVKTQIIKYVS